jgi:uncharacterized protein (TIGR02996 family)
MRKRDEKAAFEQAIEENPYDATTRKVFADWLEENGFDDEAVIQREWTPEKMHAAEAFMDDYAAQLSEDPDEEELKSRIFDREELLEIAHMCLDGEKYAGIGLGFQTPDIVWEKRREFWEHFMVLTGRPVPDDKREATFVSCAC